MPQESSKAKVARRPQDAIALLRADHALVEDLFDQFESARNDARLITEIEAGKPGDEQRDAKVTVLGEYIKHSEMFPKVRKAKLDLKALGEQLQQRKEQLQEQMGAAG